MRILVALFIFGFLLVVVLSQSRIDINSCNISPANIEDKMTPAKETDLISISCLTADDIAACIFTHTEPLNVGTSSSPDIKCFATPEPDDTGKTCDTDTRIRFDVDDRKCGIVINNPKPEDTGKWNVMVVSINSQNTAESASKTVNINTYNQSTIELLDSHDEVIDRNYETSYNYDEDKEEWINGKSGWEQVEISCAARGGKPPPTIYWIINGDDNKPIDDNSDSGIFNVRTTTKTGYDKENIIEDTISELEFDVNREFLEYLNTEHSIDTNPDSGDFSFELDCVVEQGINGEYNKDNLQTTVLVRKVHSSD